MRSAQTFRKYKIKGIKFPTSSPIQAKGDKNRISCILKIEYTASGIHESCGRNKPPPAAEAIRHDLKRASEKYAASKSGIAFRNGDETQEDNATSVQS